MRGDWPGLRRRKARGQTGKRVPFVITDPCRGRFYIGPACGGAGFPGRDKSRPYDRRHGARPNGKPQPCGIANPCRGRCSHRPGNLAAARGSAGGINPAPTDDGTAHGQTGNHNPAALQTYVGADSISARTAAARGFAGGACPSPTNRGKRPAKRDGRQPCGVATPVGDDACIVPGTLRRRRVPRAG